MRPVVIVPGRADLPKVWSGDAGPNPSESHIESMAAKRWVRNKRNYPVREPGGIPEDRDHETVRIRTAAGDHRFIGGSGVSRALEESARPRATIELGKGQSEDQGGTGSALLVLGEPLENVAADSEMPDGRMRFRESQLWLLRHGYLGARSLHTAHQLVAADRPIQKRGQVCLSGLEDEQKLPDGALGGVQG